MGSRDEGVSVGVDGERPVGRGVSLHSSAFDEPKTTKEEVAGQFIVQ